MWLRVVHWLVALYPADFRRRWGAEVVRTARELDREQGGALRRASVVADAFVTLIRAWIWRLTRPGEASLADYARQDLRYALRQFARTPLLTLFACVSLAIGIGTATSAFSLFNTMWLKKLPVPDPDRIVFLDGSLGGEIMAGGPFSHPDYLDIAGSGVFAALSATQGRPVVVSREDGAARRERLDFVSANYFQMLGLQTAVGRPFSSWPGAAELVLDYRAWKYKFDSDRSVVGRTLRLNGIPVTVVGVAPEQLISPSGKMDQFGWATLSVIPALEARPGMLSERNANGFHLAGRLRPDITLESAQQRLDVLSGELARAFPDRWGAGQPRARPVRVLTYHQNLVGPDNIVGFYGFVGMIALLFLLVLLLACTNVAGLLMARALARAHEIAVRITLGASRARLLAQLLLESMLLALLGGAAGCLLAYWSVRLLNLEETLSIVTVDWRVITAATAISCLAALMFGLVPALHALRTDFRSALNSLGAGTARTKLRGLLIGVQVGISVLFMLAAAFAARGVRTQVMTSYGFITRGLVVVRPDLTQLSRDTAAARMFVSFLGEAAVSIPGVQSVGTAMQSPFDGAFGRVQFTLPDGRRVPTSLNIVGHNYFRVLGLEPRRGRLFAPDDRLGGPRVAVVNESYAHSFGPDVLGQVLRPSDKEAPLQIIGVVPDLTNSVSSPVRPLVYLSDVQRTGGNTFLAGNIVMRVTPGSEVAVIKTLRSRIQSRYPDVIAPRMLTLDQQLANQLMPQRMTSLIALSAGALELLLAAVGLYGLMLYLLLARTREVGVRMALGARPVQASWAIARDGLRYALRGVAVGLLLGIPGALIADKTLVGTDPTDPVPFLAALSVVLLAVAGAACIPARRAARLQPAVALRHD